MSSDPLAAFQFQVVLGKETYGFSKLSGLQRERNITTYQEGGLNGYVHLFPGPAKSGGTLKLERGAYAGENFPFYLTGERLSIPMRVEVWNPSKRQQIDKCYTLTGLIVKRWEVGELDALQNALLIDRFELDYEEISVS